MHVSQKLSGEDDVFQLWNALGTALWETSIMDCVYSVSQMHQHLSFGQRVPDLSQSAHDF